MIYTSYFAHMKHLSSNCIPIAISATVPDGIHCLHLKKLAPSYDNLMQYRKDNDWAKYSKRYKEETLSKFKPQDIVDEIYNLAGSNTAGKDIVLLCYEKDNKACHRSLVADFLTQGGIPGKEY